MATYTISFQSRGKANQAHNRRDKDAVERANQRDKDAGLDPHIDVKGEYENWVDKRPMQALHEAMDGVIEAYNAKQKRRDRRTNLQREVDKYQKLIAGKKSDLVREVIIEVGNEKCHPPEDECYDFYRCAYNKFKKENPNLKIVGVYYHKDEPKSAPHLHIDYIPLHKKRKRGLDLQLGMAGALEDLGYSNAAGYATPEAREEGALAAWDNHMRDVLHTVAHNMGYQTVKGVSKGRGHEHTMVHKQAERIRENARTIEQQITQSRELDRQNAERTLERARESANPFKRSSIFDREVEIGHEPIVW